MELPHGMLPTGRQSSTVSKPMDASGRMDRQHPFSLAITERLKDFQFEA